MAWALWIAGPFLLHLPVHDFYLGAFGRGLLKLALAVVGWTSLLVASVAYSIAVDEDHGSGVLGPVFWVGLAIAVALALVTVAWWIVDGAIMSRRLERLDAELRGELARDHGVEPWSF